MRISKSVMSVGGVVLAAALIGFTNPNAVHAVTAALVQVTNTSSNPVVTQSVGPQAANMVHLRCIVSMLGSSPTGCQPLSPDGVLGSIGYTVPVGQSLVVTGVDLTPRIGVCSYDYAIFVQTTGNTGNTVLQLTTTNSLVTTHLTYPSGVVIGGGITPMLAGLAETSTEYLSCNATDEVEIYGYLTAS